MTTRRLPISPSQWHALLGDFHDVPCMVALDGPLSVGRLEHALALVVARHEPLRTCYPLDEEGVPVQEIWSSFQPTLDKLDLTAASLAERERALAEWFKQAKLSHDDAQRAPPVRAALAKLSNVEHVFLTRLGYVVADMMGARVLFEDLCKAYADPKSLPEIVKPFTEFCEVWIEPERLEYWRKALTPFRCAEDDVASTQQATSEGWAWDPSDIDSAKAAARREGVSFFAFHLAALAALRARTGAHETLVAVQFANRPEDAMGLVGHFADVMFVPTRWNDDESLGSLVRRTHESLMGALENAVPRYAVAEELGPIEFHAHFIDDLSFAPLVKRGPFSAGLEELIRGRALFVRDAADVRACRVALRDEARHVACLTAEICGGETPRVLLFWPGEVAPKEVRAAADLYRRVLGAPTSTRAADLLR